MNKYINKSESDKYIELLNNLNDFPFSFSYNNEEYKGFNDKYFNILSKKTKKIGSIQTTEIKFNFKNELIVTLLITHYYSHSVTEWTVWFENNSNEDSGVISNAKTIIKLKGEKPLLKGILGDHVNKYRPYGYDLSQAPAEFISKTGRATHIYFPYFNLEYGNGGAIFAIGWAGTWRAEFKANNDEITYSAESVINLNTFLKPNEKIRTALFVYAPYEVRDDDFATNYWRDWYIEYNLPKDDGKDKPLLPFSTSCLACDTGRDNSDGSISEAYDTWKPSMEKMISENVKADFRWLDAGWYIRPDLLSAVSNTENDWWQSVGTWTLDENKWPGKTLLESTDFARENGMRTFMWFEPERVTDPINLEKNFGYNKNWAIEVENVLGIANNIGDEACYRWTVDKICKTLTENKVEMYREDNNFDSAALWAHLDNLEGENRNGITECKFINNHYRMWDEIIECTKSIGGCGFVDSCASGGGRNDLESMRRGVPVLRSDSDRTTIALRLSMTTSFNKWIPFCGAATDEKDIEWGIKGAHSKYIWRGSYLACLNASAAYQYNKNLDYEMLRYGLNEWKEINKYLLKEFYVHTPWHTQNDIEGFTAFSFYDSKEEKGIILSFRQEKCELNELSIKLKYADNNSKYKIIDKDTMKEYEYSGAELSNKLIINFKEPKTSHLYFIEKID